MGRMHVDVGGIVKNAINQGWDADRLQPVFPNMPRTVVQKLLDGQAVVANDDGYGNFDVVAPPAPAPAKALPLSDPSHSDFTIAAAQELENARLCIEQAYKAQAAGNTERATNFMRAAILGFEVASQKLQAHADYIKEQLQ